MTPDNELLGRYAMERDEAAFAELVRRHLDHMYSTALRLVGNDSHLAEDVVQSVFADLARKATSLRHRAALSGWLHTSARFAAAKLVRGEQRRRQREQTALAESSMTSNSPTDWEQIRPLLDETIGELTDADRDAILLRYFERKSFGEVGAALGLSENAARMRVSRAIEKLRSRLLLRGVTSSAAAIGTALAQNLVGTAPSGLGARVVNQALIAGTAGSLGGAGWFSGMSTPGKLLAGVTLLAIVASVGILSNFKPSARKGENTSDQAPAVATVTEADNHPGASKATAQNRVENAPVGSQLTLYFLDAESSQPITNRVIGLRGWERDQQLLVEKKVELEKGQCVAPFERGAKSRYWILTHIDGYADVRLRWNPDRGESIPDFFAVRLVRPARIGGQVVDPSGSPVSGATVGFNTEEVGGVAGSPEDHCIDFLRAKTDSEGRWQINRIAPEMVRRLFGTATHPDYSAAKYVMVNRQPDLEKQLLSGTLIFHLGEGITVSGSVLDDAGRPISSASVRVGILASSATKETKTTADGHFAIGGCQAAEGLVSVEADGFAPAVQKLKLQPKLEPLRFELGRGEPLIVRIADRNGTPISGAGLWLDSFPRSQISVPVPQLNFQGKSDDQGLIIWSNAPQQGLPFSVHAPDCMTTDITLKPDGVEHLVTLQPAFVISGTVRDFTTGELIPRFRMGMGWPRRLNDGEIQTNWSTIERFWITFSGGDFRHMLQEGVIGGTPNPGYVFRFEADGHAPFVTRIYQSDEGEVQLDVRLHPVEDLKAMAYTPDGQVAHDAQVAVLRPGSNVQLVPGGFAGPLGYALAPITRVDAQGWFTVSGEQSIRHIVLAHPSGYAETTPEQLKRDGAVRLNRWASLQGIWQANGQPVANTEVVLQWSRPPTTGFMLDSSAYHTTTDQEGRFNFSQVPSGSLQILARLSKGPGAGLQKVLDVEVGLGEATQVSITNALPDVAR